MQAQGIAAKRGSAGSIAAGTAPNYMHLPPLGRHKQRLTGTILNQSTQGGKTVTSSVPLISPLPDRVVGRDGGLRSGTHRYHRRTVQARNGTSCNPNYY